MLCFLSGLPRSGSTVLAALLNQNPVFRVSPTSGLNTLMGSMVSTWDGDNTIHPQGKDIEELYRLLRGVIKSKYDFVDSKIVIDKHRGWPQPGIIQTMEKVLGYKPKIIATVRDVKDCAASFVRIAKPENLDEFLLDGHLIAHLKTSYIHLHEGFSYHPECFCFVDYEDLLNNPQDQLKKIHDFLGVDSFAYDFNNIDGDSVAENDEEVWNIPGLHDIKPILKKQHNQLSEDVLGWRHYTFEQPKFWKKEQLESKIKYPIDLQLDAARTGDFEKAYEIGQFISIQSPQDNRAAFNRGVLEMMRGNLYEGSVFLERGRLENVYGDKKPNTPTRIWQGFETVNGSAKPATVLLYLEGGLGDQIWQVRFAKDIVNRGAKVIVACASELVELFSGIDHISAVITKDAVGSVYHDYYLPGFHCPITFKLEYEQVKGNPYIEKLPSKLNKKKRIGLRWQGNPLFENDHKKYFSAELLFNSVKECQDVEFISLQRDEGSQHRPEWVEQVPLDMWKDTQKAISSCDLVITSCTSVAHMSAAMGVQTWVIVPLLPYFIWAFPGEKSPWYDSVKLFRQTKYEDWDEVFNQISIQLKLI